LFPDLGNEQLASFNHYANPSTNPYAAPVTAPAAAAAPSSGFGSAESTRKKYLSHEASVKSVGLLYFLGAIFGLLAGVFYLGMSVFAIGNLPNGATDPRDAVALQVARVFAFGLGTIVTALSLFQGFVALGLRKLTPWTRIGGSVIAFFGLLGFPLGTLISAYILWLLLSRKGEVVFSAEYQKVIRSTPHIRYRTSIIVWLFLGLLVLILLMGLMVGLLAARR
jgi:hypothetical protein